MKTTFQLLFALVLMFSLTACGGSDTKEAETGDAKEVSDNEGASKYAVDPEGTTVKWTGYKVDGSSHYGTFPVKVGELEVEGESVVGGTFSFDIANLTVDDYEEGTEDHGKLVGHLKADDFFAAEKFPEGTFTIVSVEEKAGENGETHEVTGNLKLRDKENSITFPATVDLADGSASVSAKTAIDRLKWDISFDKTNPAGEMIVKDKVDIEIDLKANQAQS